MNLIVSQRAYEANSKVVKAADEMYQEMNNVTQMMMAFPFLLALAVPPAGCHIRSRAT